MNKLLSSLATMLLITGCGGDDVDDSIVGDVVYEVSFKADWSSATHPKDFPSNAHFSKLIGISHPAGASFFSVDSDASTGLKNMAETGSISPLADELEKLATDGKGLDRLIGSGIGSSPGTSTAMFGVDAKNTHVTIVSMIAPSPDWFVAARDFSLVDADGKYLDSLTVDAVTWDSGTDSGTTFKSDNSATSPKGKVAIIDLADIAGSGDKFGTFTFTKQK